MKTMKSNDMNVVFEGAIHNKVKIKKLYPDAKIPTYGSVGAACADLYAYCPEELNKLRYYMVLPGETVKVKTGVALELNPGTCALIYARSGMATKQGLRPANCVGVCDSDYRGEYIVALHNDSNGVRYIAHGDRIAQMMIVPYLKADFEEVGELSDTQRGEGGFGSTGVK